MTLRSWQTPFVILVCGTLILLLSLGALNTLGLMLAPISTDLGWNRGVFSLAVAMQSLVWGIATPLAGGLADKYGPGRVLAFGGIIYAAGLCQMGLASAPVDAHLGVGFLMGVGMAMTTFPIVLSVIGRVTSEKKRGLYIGIASAGGSSGMFVMVPMAQLFIGWQGWAIALILIAATTALIVPLAAALSIGPPSREEAAGGQSLSAAVREAGGHRGFLLLSTAYFVCGFQTRFVGTHFPAMLEDFEISGAMAATALTLIGLFNIVGCFVWGVGSGRFRAKYLLAWLYLLRSLVMMAFILIPVSGVSVTIFSCVVGLLWLGTVPLTGAVVARIFGPTYVATLYGLSFFGHQMGSFLGIWMGGYLYDLTGSYDAIWWIAVALGFVAALMHIPIDDRPMIRVVAQGA